MAAEGDGTGTKAKKQAGNKDGGKQSEKKRKRNIDASAGADAPADATAQQQQQPKQQQAAEAPAAAAGAGPERASDAGGPARKKQRRHKRGEEPAQPLDPQEALRRQRQRELRALANKMRAEGKDYVPPRKGSQPRSKDAGGGKGDGKGGKDGEARKARHYLGDKTPGWRPFNSVEVIVLPIFWNNNKEEKAAVLAASERARDILASAGLSADMDASNKYTPGQKMKYWETMGVRVRVELGPRDVANGNCVVALSTKRPGEVATKNVVNMRHKMLDAVRAALQKAKAAGQPDDEEEEEEEAEEKQQQQEAEDAEGAAGGSGKASKRQKDPAKGTAGKQRQAGTESEDKDEEGDGDAGPSEEEDEGDVVAAAVAAAKSRHGGVLQKTANPEARKLKQQRDRGEQGQDDAAEAPAEADVGEQHVPGPGLVSADALEDDFGDVLEFEAEEDKLTLSKKDRMKKAIKQAKAKRKAERLGGGGGGGSDDPDGGAAAGAGEEPEGTGWGKKAAGVGVARQDKAAGPKKAKVVTF